MMVFALFSIISFVGYLACIFFYWVIRTFLYEVKSASFCRG